MRLEVVSIEPDTGARRHPLVFVHGAWLGGWSWERFLPWFAARGWQCHAVDLRGHGGSPNDRSLRFTRISHYVEDLASVVDALTRDPILIGHSMGGLVVQRFLEEHDLPRALLLAPIPVGGVIRAALRTARHHPLAFAAVNARWNLGALVRSRRVARDILFAVDTPEVELDEHLARLQDESYLAFLEMLLTVRPRPQLVHTPVAIIAGSADRLIGLDELRRTAGAYGVELKVIEGAAHNLMLDPRWEQVAEVMAAELEP